MRPVNEALAHQAYLGMNQSFDQGNYVNALQNAKLAMNTGARTNKYGYTDNRYLNANDYQLLQTRIGQSAAGINYNQSLAAGNPQAALANAGAFFDAGNTKQISVNGFPSMVAAQQLATSNPGMYNFMQGQQNTAALRTSGLSDYARDIQTAALGSQFVSNVQQGNPYGALNAANLAIAGNPAASYPVGYSAGNSYIPKGSSAMGYPSNVGLNTMYYSAGAKNAAVQDAKVMSNLVQTPLGPQPAHLSNVAILDNAANQAQFGQALNQNLVPVAMPGLPNTSLPASPPYNGAIYQSGISSGPYLSQPLAAPSPQAFSIRSSAFNTAVQGGNMIPGLSSASIPGSTPTYDISKATYIPQGFY